MKLSIELNIEESIALRRFASGHHPLPIDEAAARALREYLIGTGDLEVVSSIDEDGDVAGSA